METELKKLRENSKTTQQAIADYAGIAVKSYRKYEQGEAYPTVDVALRLAAYYGKLVEDVFNDKSRNI